MGHTDLPQEFADLIRRCAAGQRWTCRCASV
jgi:hypothetical protein